MKVNMPVTQRERSYDDDVSIISTTDLKGVITYVNQDFIDVSGFTEAELLGQNHNIVRHPDMPPTAFADLWQTVKAGRSWRGLVKNRCKNGDHYWVDAYVTPVYQHGQLIGYQSVRSKPGRSEVDAASALYAKLRANPNTKLPRRFNAFDVPITARISASLAVVALLALAVGLFSIYAGGAEIEQLRQHEQQLATLAGSWDSYRANPSDGELLAKMDQQVQALRHTDNADHPLTVARDTVARNNWLIAALCAAGLSLITVIGFLVVRTVVIPMQRIVTLAKGMAGGNLMERIDTEQQDEVGQMVQAMKLLQARLRTVFGRFAESSRELAASAAQLSSSSEHAMANMGRQQSETDQVATAMNEMSATVQEVADNTARTAGAARDAEHEAEESKTVVSRARHAIEQLAQEVQRTADVIHELEQDSDQISTITNVISSIADQTNLLALNAAIEAARAGESGRGFAVVADEVRTLAARTQQATGEIRTMIDNLRQGIGKAVTVMAAGRQQADTAVAEAHGTEQSLHTIVRAVGQISDMTTQIATATEEQTAVAEEMNHNVTAISQLAGTTTEQAHDIQQSGTHLAEMAQRLQELINQFEIGGGAGFDFAAAKSAHLAWKARLRAFLDGDSAALSASQATSHHDCALGKWYYGEGMAHYGRLGAMQAIEAPHAELHTLIKQIMELKQSGNQQEAERFYARVEPLSHEVVRQLDVVEREARSRR